LKEKPTISSISKIEIRFSDCDPLGIVWHGNYVKYLEDGREAFSKEHGFDNLEFYLKGYSTPIVSIHCDYKKPLTYRDVALVKTTYRDTKAAKIIFDYVIYKEATGEVICTGQTTQVFVEKDTMTLLLTNPDFIEDWKTEKGL
jgi:acyl-CoA thioester hydrolase